MEEDKMPVASSIGVANNKSERAVQKGRVGNMGEVMDG